MLFFLLVGIIGLLLSVCVNWWVGSPLIVCCYLGVVSEYRGIKEQA